MGREPVRILFLEDEPSDMELALATLEEELGSVEARRVEDKTGLRRELKEFHPDLLLLDFSLPGFDGLSALRVARELAPEVPAIMFTGSLDAEILSACLGEGADDFVPKPHLARLPSAASALLEKRREEAERAKAEAALRASEERFRSLADTANDPILVADRNGIIQYSNRAASAVFGYAPEELLGSSVTILMADDHQDRHLRAMEDAATGSRIGYLGRTSEAMGRRKDGTEVPLEISLSSSGAGAETLFFAFLRDISDRVAAQEALELLTREHELILNSLAEGVMVVDAEGKGRFVNPAVERITGWDEDDLLGRDVHENLHRRPGSDHFHRVAQCSVLQPLSSERSSFGRTTFFGKDGSELTIQFNSSPVELYPGDKAAVVVFQDVSEEVSLEQQLRQAQKMEAVGQLTGGIAHDFNNLLSVILLQVEAIQGDIPPEDAILRSNLAEVREAAEKAAEMTGKLLGFSRRAPLRRVARDLADVVKGMRAMLRRVIPESIEFAVEPGTETYPVRADAGAVEQILLNLVTNARDAMPDGGQLTIELERVTLEGPNLPPDLQMEGEPFARITVRDSGTGMDQATLLRVFDPFFTTKSEGSGTGLGLAMVYGLMKQHDGFVRIQSQPGKGTEILLHFPLLAEPEENLDALVAPSAHPLGTETVLVVEDDPALLVIATQSLKRHGYRVLEAPNGEEALTLLIQHGKDVDLVLSDVVMPRMGGAMLQRAARTLGLDVTFLFTTGYLVSDEVPTLLERENTRLLEKPWRMTTLLNTVREVLDGDG